VVVALVAVSSVVEVFGHLRFIGNDLRMTVVASFFFFFRVFGRAIARRSAKNKAGEKDSTRCDEFQMHGIAPFIDLEYGASKGRFRKIDDLHGEDGIGRAHSMSLMIRRNARFSKSDQQDCGLSASLSHCFGLMLMRSGWIYFLCGRLR